MSGYRHFRRFKREQEKQKKSQNYISKVPFSCWGPNQDSPSLSNEVINKVYRTISESSDVSNNVITALEASQYLETYLWPLYDPAHFSKHYVLSIVLMVNQKFRERVPSWKAFEDNPDFFPDFFRSVLVLILEQGESSVTMREKNNLLTFIIHSCNSLEVKIVREQVQKLVTLGIWNHIQPGRLQNELKRHPRLKKYWAALLKKDQQQDEVSMKRINVERVFFYTLIQDFYSILDTVPVEGDIPDGVLGYCERMMELLIDLQGQPLMRRFLNTLLDDVHIVVKCSLSNLCKREPEGHLFTQLLDRLKFYCGFEINDQTGEALTEHNMTEMHYSKITSLQLASFRLFPELRSFSLSNVAGVDTRDSLIKHFGSLSSNTLHNIAAHLYLLPALSEGESTTYTSQFLLELLVSHHERRLSQLETINNTPLYPTEEVLWDESIVPYEYFDGEGCFALPKLNLQFLTLHDYLLRNLTLFRLESTYEIREDIEDSIGRMKPWVTPDGETQFAGWARMAQLIEDFSIIEVGKPKLGENRPSRVRADVGISVGVKDHVRMEWEALRKHDVCFLVTVRAGLTLHQDYDHGKNFAKQVGVVYVRGCEIEGMLDSEGKLIEEGPEPKPEIKGDKRTFRLWLDTNQYQRDMESVVKGAEDVYGTFNVFMRRKPKENNFKAVIETIRDLMNTECVAPDWIHDILLGYGDPASAHYTRMPSPILSMDFNDTFLSLQHLMDSFPQYTVKCATADNEEKLVPPFKITFPDKVAGLKRKHHDDDADDVTKGAEPLDKPVIQVKPYTVPIRGPYPYNIPKKNSVPFTPTQVEAIRAGMQPGLTMVVGPPGTGKTDVAVQIISNLYHNFPDQRTLLVTHSNQALNQLFEKIMALDIDERHLLRLGHGEEELQTEKDFSRFGRVNFILALRLELLKEVERLQTSLDVSGDVSYTCETAGHFYLYQVVCRWERYCAKIKQLGKTEEGLSAIREQFPFTRYFSNAPQPFFKGESFSSDWAMAEGCFRHIRKIFKQLEEFRAFELLRTSRDRVNYLLTKEAKIIALTCTHAALKRKDLVELAFKYDNVLMEEAAQILEVETFIPLMLQNPQDGFNRLKRVIMIGDHHQLPPVIKNMAFQKFSNMEQSMFTRFVRLGVPVIQLDAQGRARPSLCSLYNWRYKSLGNLPHVMRPGEYQLANPGFTYDYQLINVEDFNGVGETTPTPFFYQNLAEAEYAVALFMYMRLQGYPPDKIAILTTYNGQKHLIRDVLSKRCANNPAFGLPEKVTTVDRYQGQQNDYIILSLVRTKHVGHVRDVRRLVVAMSRARLGLYIVARVALFTRCKELQPAFNILMGRPQQLSIIPMEFYPPNRPVDVPAVCPSLVIENMQHLTQLVYQDYQTRIAALRTQQQQQMILEPPKEQHEGEEMNKGEDVNEGGGEEINDQEGMNQEEVNNEEVEEEMSNAGELRATDGDNDEEEQNEKQEENGSHVDDMNTTAGDQEDQEQRQDSEQSTPMEVEEK